jgi:hypothetical protein
MSTGLRSRSGPARAGRSPVDAARWFGVRAAALVMAIVVMVAVGGFLLARQASGPTAAWARASGSDGLWIGHAWLAGGPGGPGAAGRSGPGLAGLAARIRNAGISDVYVQAGQVDAAGRLNPAQYAEAGTFLASFRAALPHVRVCAWIGGAVGRGQLNLDDAATRAGIVASASALLHTGFNGISYDLTPVASGDSGLLALLSATRALHPAVLSVTAPKLEPLAGMALPAALILRRPTFWTTGYLAQVARRVSQVTVMSYDTGVLFPSWYSGYVARETSLALHAVPPGVGLVIGVPAFAGSTLGHHGSAETVAAALRGIRAALTAGHHPRAGFGTGLYTAGTATAQDWSSYESGWVHPSS